MQSVSKVCDHSGYTKLSESHLNIAKRIKSERFYEKRVNFPLSIFLKVFTEEKWFMNGKLKVILAGHAEARGQRKVWVHNYGYRNS